MRRLLDILLAGSALLLLSVLLLPLALILRCTGEGEVFFRQDRVGQGGRIFRLCKFATMLRNSPQIGTGTVTVHNDPRVLPVGRFLRKTKINELPQLWNVLVGDMSLIGPRPQTQRCFDAFPADLQQSILQVRPGLSGIGSIIFRDEEELMHEHGHAAQFYDQEIMPYKGQVEAWFVENNHLRTYLTLIGLTVWVVLFPRSQAAWKIFPDLPRPDGMLAAVLVEG